MSGALAPGLLRDDLPKAGFDVDERPCALKLDQNEAPGSLSAPLRQTILASLQQADWQRYPQPARYRAIKAQVAPGLGVRPEELLLTAGCDQVILATFLAAGGAGRRARIFEPTYPIYAHAAAISGTTLDRQVLDADYRPPDEALGDDVELLVLARPNNPTGTVLPRPRLEATLERRKRLLLLDEAYAGYAGEDAGDLLAAHPQLLIARSLSKGLLAGVRLGYALGHPEIIATLERLLFAPYHLNHWQLAVAAALPEIQLELAAALAELRTARDDLRQALLQRGLLCWPSGGNFLLFGAGPLGVDAARLYDELARRGVRLRDVSRFPGLGDHLRVTIGTQEQNTALLAALDASLAGR